MRSLLVVMSTCISLSEADSDNLLRKQKQSTQASKFLVHSAFTLSLRRNKWKDIVPMALKQRTGTDWSMSVKCIARLSASFSQCKLTNSSRDIHFASVEPQGSPACSSSSMPTQRASSFCNASSKKVLGARGVQSSATRRHVWRRVGISEHQAPSERYLRC